MASTVSGERHALPDRVFHWAIAGVAFVLLLSSLLPIVGIKFDWVSWHWISGVTFTALVLFHLLRVFLVLGLKEMLPQTLSASREQRKYDGYQKSYHWCVALIVIALIATGLLMLLKLDTPLWDRNPGLLTDLQWGYVYVAHGIATYAIIFFVLVHVYFAALPEHRNLLRAMIGGREGSRSNQEGVLRGEPH